MLVETKRPLEPHIHGAGMSMMILGESLCRFNGWVDRWIENLIGKLPHELAKLIFPLSLIRWPAHQRQSYILFSRIWIEDSSTTNSSTTKTLDTKLSRSHNITRLGHY